MQVSGRVIKQPVAVGSKSERGAVCLDTGTRRYILRRKQGHPFVDDVLEQLVGKNIAADGNLIGGGTFLLSNWAEV